MQFHAIICTILHDLPLKRKHRAKVCKIAKKHIPPPESQPTHRTGPKPHHKKMLTRQRKQLILDRLRATGQILAKDLSRELAISEDTIRRDLRELAAQGQLTRVHGGALPAAPAMSVLNERAKISSAEKTAIARAAIDMLYEDQTIILDGGTTTLELARQFPLDLKATVITHSPIVAAELLSTRRPNLRLITIGGTIYHHSGVAVGTTVFQSIQSIRADVFFLGATGVHFQSGITTGDLEESHIKKAMMDQAGEVVLMASQEKINASGPFKIADLSEIATIIVAHALPDNLDQSLKDAACRVLRA